MTTNKSESFVDTKTVNETASTSQTKTQNKTSTSAKVSSLFLKRHRKVKIDTVKISKTSSDLSFSIPKKTLKSHRLRKSRCRQTSKSQNKLSAPPTSLSQRTTESLHLGCIRPNPQYPKGPTLTRNLRLKTLST